MISPSYPHANTASQLLSQALSPLSPNTRSNTHTSNRFFSCLRFFKALLPTAEILPRSPQVWWVNLVPPRPTFHLQKGSETAVPREGGPGGQGNLSEEGGEMQWLLHGFEEPDKGVGCWLWVYRVVNRAPDYRTASRCYSPHRYCQNSLDVSRKNEHFQVLFQMGCCGSDRRCWNEQLLWSGIPEHPEWQFMSKQSEHSETSSIWISVNTQKKSWQSL